jgi:hypothetical protein
MIYPSARCRHTRNLRVLAEGIAADQNKLKRVWVPPGSSNWQLITGRMVAIPLDRIIEVTEEEIVSILQNGGKRVD